MRRIPPRVSPLDDDLEAAEGRRILTLSRSDREEAPVLRPAVEQEAVRAAPDHDHRAEVLACHRWTHDCRHELDPLALPVRKREVDVAYREALVQLEAGSLCRQPWPEVAQRELRVDRGAIEPVPKPRGEVRDRPVHDRDAERHIGVRLRNERALDRLVDNRCRSEDVGSDEYLRLSELELQRLRELLL